MSETVPAWTLLVLCLSLVCIHALQIPGEDRRDEDIMVYRRDDVSGLFPFPRVGRAQISSEDIFDQRSQGSVQGSVSKRQGLIPFPRVGKRHQHHATFVSSLPPSGGSDAFYDDYAGVGRGQGVVGGEEERWVGGKRSEGAAQEGMWFGPRLGRRRRRSVSSGKRRPGAASYWTVVDETGGTAREYLERRPHSLLRNKEQMLMVRPAVEDDDFAIEESDVLYGDAAETPGGEEESSAMGGRRRRRQPVDEGTTKAVEEKAAEGGNDGASAATSGRWKGGRA